MCVGFFCEFSLWCDCALCSPFSWDARASKVFCYFTKFTVFRRRVEGNSIQVKCEAEMKWNQSSSRFKLGFTSNELDGKKYASQNINQCFWGSNSIGIRFVKNNAVIRPFAEYIYLRICVIDPDVFTKLVQRSHFSMAISFKWINFGTNAHTKKQTKTKKSSRHWIQLQHLLAKKSEKNIGNCNRTK